MLKFSKTIIGAAGLALALGVGQAAAETIKVGIIAPLSGPFAEWGDQFQDGINTYVAQHGDSVAGHEIEFIYRDLDKPNPPRAKSLAQELVVGEGVDYLGGFVFTPDALAVAPLITQAGVPTVIFNAATSIITKKSPNFVRTSFTLGQISVPAAKYALEDGIGSVITLVSDYGPGLDAEKAFVQTFEAGGGEVLDTIRMPLSTTDFGPFMQRVKTLGPDAVFAFTPAGPPTFSLVKAFVDNGLKENGVRFLATQEATQALYLGDLGEVALGFESSGNYAITHDSDENREFLATLEEINPGAIANFATVGAYDGTRMIYEMVKATDGEKDAATAMEAVKGMSWESPRGPVTIDPEDRTVVQNIYIRRVVKGDDGKVENEEFLTFEAQPDHGLTLK